MPEALECACGSATPSERLESWCLGNLGPSAGASSVQSVEASPPQRSPRGIRRVYGEVRSGDGQLAPVSFNKNEGNREGGNGYGQHQSGGENARRRMRALWAEAEAATTG